MSTIAPRVGPNICHVVGRLKVAADAAERSGLPDLRQLLDDAGISLLHFQLALQEIATGTNEGTAEEHAQAAIAGYAMLRQPKRVPIVGSGKESEACTGGAADPVSP